MTKFIGKVHSTTSYMAEAQQEKASKVQSIKQN